MSNDGKAPDPFGLSGEGAPAGGGQAPQDDPYAALEQAAQQGVQVQQPDAGYDDIFGGAAVGGSAPPPPSSGLEMDAPPGPPPGGHDHIPMPDPMMDQGMGMGQGMGQPMGQMGMPSGAPRALPPRKSNGAFKIITAIGVLVIVGGLGFFLVSGKPPERPAKPTDESSTSDLAKELAERPPNAPVCWTTNAGFQFVYKTSGGDEKVVDRIEDVPKLYRAGAACKPM